jgi:CBS domain-containing protein
VLDPNGEAVGVLSRADLVAYDCQRYGRLEPAQPNVENDGWSLRLRQNAPPGSTGAAEACPVSNIMNPVIFSVAKVASAEVVIEALLTLGVHRLFVTDDDGTVIGVISSTDVLRHLCRAHETDSPQ